MILWVDKNIGILFLKNPSINSFEGSRIVISKLVEKPKIIVEAIRPEIRIVNAGDED